MRVRLQQHRWRDCQLLYPTLPAMPADFVYVGLTTPTVTAPQLVFDGNDGAIKDGAGTIIRHANGVPSTATVVDGVGFRRADTGVAIWTFSSLTVPTTTTVTFAGGFAASILTVGDLVIAGTIDARGYADPSNLATLCNNHSAGPGGGAGGFGATAAGGAGGGGAGKNTNAGGAGGSYGAKGGDGGNDQNSFGHGVAVAAYGSLTISPLRGGSGGGAGGAGESGGGGGGGLQLAALGTLVISGGINAGGCGGAAGGSKTGGGGGGSGGAVLVEAPSVHLTGSAKIGAQGGSGGGGDSGTAGQPGPLTNMLAPGGPGGSNGGNGGNGGGYGNIAGQTANDAPSGNGGGGGGGGAAGRIRITSRTGSAMLDGGYLLSPRLVDTLASQGMVDIH